MNVTDFLTERGVEFEAIEHQDTFDALRLAETLHVSGSDVAKTVLLRTGADRFVVAVLPASKDVDFEKAAQVLGDGNVQLATEFEISQLFSDCELGAIPPFGAEYGLRTVVDVTLSADEHIFFEGNNHHEAFRIKFEDFRDLAQPLVIDIVAD